MALVMDLSLMLPRLDFTSSSSSAGLTRWNTLSSSSRAFPRRKEKGLCRHGVQLSVCFIYMLHISKAVGVWIYNRVHGQQRASLRSNQTNEVVVQRTTSTYFPHGCRGFGRMTAGCVKPWKGLAWHHLEPANQTCTQMFKPFLTSILTTNTWLPKREFKDKNWYSRCNVLVC